jgi:hypothetical protein
MQFVLTGMVSGNDSRLTEPALFVGTVLKQPVVNGPTGNQLRSWPGRLQQLHSVDKQVLLVCSWRLQSVAQRWCSVGSCSEHELLRGDKSELAPRSTRAQGCPGLQFALLPLTQQRGEYATHVCHPAALQLIVGQSAKSAVCCQPPPNTEAAAHGLQTESLPRRPRRTTPGTPPPPWSRQTAAPAGAPA